jgi:hypothetical protein
MNITLSADKETIRRAREIARRQGTSLNSLIRSYLQTLTEHLEPDSKVSELLSLMDQGSGNLNGHRWTREEIQK